MYILDFHSCNVVIPFSSFSVVFFTADLDLDPIVNSMV